MVLFLVENNLALSFYLPALEGGVAIALQTPKSARIKLNQEPSLAFHSEMSLTGNLFAKKVFEQTTQEAITGLRRRSPLKGIINSNGICKCPIQNIQTATETRGGSDVFTKSTVKINAIVTLSALICRIHLRQVISHQLHWHCCSVINHSVD